MTSYLDDEADVTPYKKVVPMPSGTPVVLGKQDVTGKKVSIDNPKTAFGNLKSCFHFIPMGVMFQVAEVMKLGAAKYGLKNWRKQPIKASPYYDAIYRHIIAWYEDTEEQDAESKQSHLAHIIANAMILLDATKQGKLIDDRTECEAIHK